MKTARTLWLVSALALGACKKDPPPPALVPAKQSDAARDAAFGAWVGPHLDALKAIKTGQEPAANELAAALEKVEPGLVFELGVGREAFELIISADGDLKRFAAVRRLVAAAPALPGTKVIAFRPRKDVDGFSMQVGGQRLSGANLWFTAKADAERPGLVAVTLGIEGLDGAQGDELKNAALLLLEAAVGEFDMETKVGSIDLVPAPVKPAAPWRPLHELPATLDGWK